MDSNFSTRVSNLSSNLRAYSQHLSEGKKSYIDLRDQDGRVMRSLQVSHGKTLSEKISNLGNKIQYSFNINVTKSYVSGRKHILQEIKAVKSEIQKGIKEQTEALQKGIENNDLEQIQNAQKNLQELRSAAASIQNRITSLLSHLPQKKQEEFSSLNSTLEVDRRTAYILNMAAITKQGELTTAQDCTQQIVEGLKASGNSEESLTKLDQGFEGLVRIYTSLQKEEAKSNQINENVQQPEQKPRTTSFDKAITTDDEEKQIQAKVSEINKTSANNVLSSLSGACTSIVSHVNQLYKEAGPVFNRAVDEQASNEDLQKAKSSVENLVHIQKQITIAQKHIDQLPDDAKKDLVQLLSIVSQEIDTILSTFQTKIAEQKQSAEVQLEESTKQLENATQTLHSLESNLKELAQNQAQTYSNIMEEVVQGNSPFEKMEQQLQQISTNMKSLGQNIPKEMSDVQPYLKAVSILAHAQIRQDIHGNQRAQETIFSEVAQELNELDLHAQDGSPIRFIPEEFRHGTLESLQKIQEPLSQKLSALNSNKLTEIKQDVAKARRTDPLVQTTENFYLGNVKTYQQDYKNVAITIANKEADIQREMVSLLPMGLQKKLYHDTSGEVKEKTEAFLDKHPKFDRRPSAATRIDWSQVSAQEIQQLAQKHNVSIPSSEESLRNTQKRDVYQRELGRDLNRETTFSLLKAMVENPDISLKSMLSNIVFRIKPSLKNNEEALQKLAEKIPDEEQRDLFLQKVRSPDNEKPIATIFIEAFGNDQKQAALHIIDFFSENPTYAQSYAHNMTRSHVSEYVQWNGMTPEKLDVIGGAIGVPKYSEKFNQARIKEAFSQRSSAGSQLEKELQGLEKKHPAPKKEEPSLLHRDIKWNDMGEKDLESFAKEFGWKSENNLPAIVVGLEINPATYTRIMDSRKTLQSITDTINIQNQVMNELYQSGLSRVEQYPSFAALARELGVPKLDLKKPLLEQLKSPSLKASKNAKEYALWLQDTSKPLPKHLELFHDEARKAHIAQGIILKTTSSHIKEQWNSLEKGTSDLIDGIASHKNALESIEKASQKGNLELYEKKEDIVKQEKVVAGEKEKVSIIQQRTEALSQLFASIPEANSA